MGSPRVLEPLADNKRQWHVLAVGLVGCRSDGGRELLRGWGAAQSFAVCQTSQLLLLNVISGFPDIQRQLAWCAWKLEGGEALFAAIGDEDLGVSTVAVEVTNGQGVGAVPGRVVTG